LTRHTAAQHLPRSGRHHRRHLFAALLVVPLVFGLLAAPVVAPGPVQGDQLTDARAQQAALAQKIKEQKALIASLNSSQASLQGRIASTTDQLNGIIDDLAATRRQVNAMVKDIGKVQADYATLVADLADLDRQLERLGQMEAAKKDELGQRKAELAQRIRDAWEAERTSLLETFLSGASFADMLKEMSTQLDAAEQDRILAQQIALDRETLLSLHQTVLATRADTNTLRQETAVQKQQLDRRLDELKKARAKLFKLEKAAKAVLAQEKAQYAKMAADKAKLRKTMAAAAAAKKKLQHKIDSLVATQFNQGHIPSADAGERQPALRLYGLLLGAADGQLRPLPQRDRPRRALRDPGPGLGGRPGCVLRLELCRRCRPGLDRHHRPQLVADNLVRPHDPELPGARGIRRERGPGDRARGQHRALDRGAPPLDGGVQRQLREPAPVHLRRGPARPALTGLRRSRSRC
jgi:peptidoglycan hydrolase CwlO-like protein